MIDLHYRDIFRLNGKLYFVESAIPGASHELGLVLNECDEDGNDFRGGEMLHISFGRICWERNCEHYDRLPVDKRLIQSPWRVDDLELVNRHDPSDNSPYPVSAPSPR